MHVLGSGYGMCGETEAGLSFQGVSSLEEAARSEICPGKTQATQPVQPRASKASTGERVEIPFSLGQILFLLHAKYGKV